MGSRLRQEWIWGAAVVCGLLVFGYWTLANRADYVQGIPPHDYNLEAVPAVDALVSGHVTAFLQQAPVYGGSLVLRAPFVLVAHALGAGEAWMYRASASPALLACGALGFWLASRMGRANAHWLARLAVIGVCVLNPLAREAVVFGHPEDLLGAVLCVAAVLCAIADRPIWAGVLLGLAIPNKEWAVLAVGPVLVALPRRRLLSMICAAAVAGAILAPFLIAGSINPSHGLQGVPGVNTGPIFNPQQVWWFFGRPLRSVSRLPPGWIAGLAHPLIVGLSIPLTLVYVLRLRRSPSAGPDALLLLAFLLLMRCMLDPWDISYYSIPFLLALVAWEALRYQRFPVLAVTASFLAWFLYLKIPDPTLHFTADRTALIFSLVSLSGAAAMACFLYIPGIGDRLVRRVIHPANVQPPAELG
jgi:hypothetical protein